MGYSTVRNIESNQYPSMLNYNFDEANSFWVKLYLDKVSVALFHWELCMMSLSLASVAEAWDVYQADVSPGYSV